MDFSANGREFYCYGGIGIGDASLSSEEWNLASLTSRLLYAYEREMGEADKAAEFDPEMLESLILSMNQELAGETVKWWMQQGSPFRFLEAIYANQEQAEELAIAKYWEGHFTDVVKARVLSWLATHRRVGNRIMPALTNDQRAHIEVVANG